MTVPKTLLRPVTGPISDPFGVPRDNAAGYHTGTDYVVPTGTAVHAAHDGVVAFARAGSHNGDRAVGGYGNQLWVESPDHRYGTVYAHLETLRVRTGQAVERGQPIATTDNTGISTGPHIHVELRDQLHIAEQQWGRVLDIELYYGEEDDMDTQQRLAIAVLADVIKALIAKYPPDLSDAQRVVLREIIARST